MDSSYSVGIIGGADGPTVIFLTSPLFAGFRILAICLMLVFYAIYLGKMLLQKRQGLRTDQLARGKEKGPIYYTELFLKISNYAIIPIAFYSIWSVPITAPPALPICGMILELLGVGFFGAAVITMKEQWRAGIPLSGKTRLITGGIFSWSRNPAFLGFDLLYLGVLLMFFSPVLLVFTVWAMVMLHLQILQEERFLQETFGDDFANYRHHTLRYFGRR